VRRALLALALLALLLGGGFAWLRLLRPGPTGPIPGGALRGTPAASLPADWSFANREPYLLVESRAFLLPWSGRVWFIAHRRRLHLLLPAFFGDDLKRRLDVDPRLRVEIDGTDYEQVAIPVLGDEDLAELLGPALRRQFAIDVGGAVRRIPGAAGAEMWVYRLEDPPGAASSSAARAPEASASETATPSR
jgi:hypothetical protein